MHRYIEEVLAKCHASAIVFNLLDYEYEFGNDVAPLFGTALDRDAKNPRPVYIAATGTTYTSLCDLYTAGRLEEVFRIEFVASVQDALQRFAGGRR
jgi:hypothetical protein